jgi:hypothetical protein
VAVWVVVVIAGVVVVMVGIVGVVAFHHPAVVGEGREVFAQAGAGVQVAAEEVGY